MAGFNWQPPGSDSFSGNGLLKQLASGDPVSNAMARASHAATGKKSRYVEDLVTPGAVATGQSETQQAALPGQKPPPPGYRYSMGRLEKDPAYIDPNAPKTASGTSGLPPIDYQQLASSMADSRNNDVNSGLSFGNNYFGSGNPQMKEVEDAQRQRALYGMTPQERQAYNEKSEQGINQQMSTGLRQLRTMQATNGVRGSAAAGAAIPIISQADQARGAAANNLNLADMQAREKGMTDYKNTLTGEREGLLGTAFGEAGLGATDRANAMQYGLGQQYVNALAKNQVPMPTAQTDKPWWQS